MKSYVFLFAWALGSFCLAQNTESRDQQKKSPTDLSLDNHKEKRHFFGLRKSIISGFLLDDDDTDYVSYKLYDFQAQYTYRVSERFYAGLGYYQVYENFKKRASELEVQGNLYTNTVYLAHRTTHVARLMLSYDIIKKSFLIARFNAYLPIYVNRSSDHGASKIEKNVSEPKGSSASYMRLYNDTRWLKLGSAEFVLDLLYPIKSCEVGLSPYLNFINNDSPGVGVYATVNVKF